MLKVSFEKQFMTNILCFKLTIYILATILLFIENRFNCKYQFENAYIVIEMIEK